MLFNRSLIGRVIILTVLLLVMVFGIYGLFHIHREQVHLLNSTEKSSKLLLDAIENSIFNAMRQGNSQAVQAILELVGRDEKIANVRIFHSDGTILKSAAPLEIGKRVGEDEYGLFSSGRQSDLFRSDGADVLGIVKPIVSDRRCFRCHGLGQQVVGVLNLNFSLADTKASLIETTRVFVFSNIVMVILLSVGISFILIKFVKRPLSAMAEKMARVESGDMSVRMTPESGDEVGSLMQSFSSMVVNLEKAQKELELVHYQQMERVDRLASVGEMATGVAHEVKNPLAGINGAITIIAEEFDKDNPVQAIIAEIKQQIQRLDKTSTDLLCFGRPAEPEFAPVDINELIKSTTFFVNQHPESKDVTWIEELTKGLPYIKVDEKQLQQVLYNVMINAVQAMGRGGVLTINTDLIHRETVDWVSVVVKDTGPGISEEVKENIFTPFFTTKTRGTGLGLAICRRLIEQQSGRIELESVVGVGTSVMIELPVSKDVEPEQRG